MAELHDELKSKVIARPDEPRHFMRLLKPGYRVIVKLGENVVASSLEVVKVVEVARDIYEPVCYFPRSDVSMEMLSVIPGKSTHCPLKGDTEYFDVGDLKETAWSYNRPLEFADSLKDMIAFDLSQMELTEIRSEKA